MLGGYGEAYIDEGFGLERERGNTECESEILSVLRGDSCDWVLTDSESERGK